MLDMLPSSFVDVASTSYRESTVGVDCLALGAFSGSDCSSVGSTMSKNPSITKKSPISRSPALARYDPSEKNKISTPLSSPLPYPPAVTEEAPVALEESFPISSNDKELNGDCKKPVGGGIFPLSETEKEGDASEEVSSLSGGCDRPIDTAMQFITSCRRSKSTPSK
jgi:hypothetical protein